MDYLRNMACGPRTARSAWKWIALAAILVLVILCIDSCQGPGPTAYAATFKIKKIEDVETNEKIQPLSLYCVGRKEDGVGTVVIGTFLPGIGGAPSYFIPLPQPNMGVVTTGASVGGMPCSLSE